MSLSCISQGFIGIQGSCDLAEDGTSGLYINDLPGITISMASNSASEHHVNGIRLMRNMELQAIDMTSRDFIAKLSPMFRSKNIVDSRQIGYHRNEFSPNSFTGYYFWEVNKSGLDRFTDLFVEYIEFNSMDTVTTTVEIVDNGATTTRSWDLTPGVNRLYLNYTAQGRQVFVGMDMSVITQIANLDSGRSCLYCGGSSCDCYGGTGCLYSYRMERANGGTNIESGGWSGIVIGASCRCNEDKLTCLFRNELAYAIRYKYAALLLSEVVFTDRTNPIIRNKKEDAQELLIHIMGGESSITGFAHKGKYWKELKTIVKQAQSYLERQNSKCITCTGMRIATGLP